ncbi:DUF1672 domain-containing protein [Rossellomorea marisflavi]|uniref:DUF1672 domain-containing protein n=1 Tax=Rossellomorea marisflavi TaxID=189381 RepID=UPI0027A98667|nr:DUF1672 domain-containing protein [Rossellomorea marisflavi]UTE71808.1 DUF1672 domain-containing protein [Rossellomorea marisflavi]
MKRKRILFACGISILLIGGGCSNIDMGTKSESQKTDTKQDESNRPKDMYESVLTYTGDGYDLPGGEENEEIAKEHKDEVIKATKDYLKKEYNTDVEVHNIAGNQDGVTVFYESVGNIHFYSTAIVPIDTQNKKILTDQVWTLEGRVETAIKGALYAYIMDNEFEVLDDLLESIGKNNHIVGRLEESLENTGGNGYMTPYYFVVVRDDEAMTPVYNLYMKKPSASRQELAAEYLPSKFDSEKIGFSVQFFMKDQKSKPDKNVLDLIVNEIKRNDGVPKGHYEVRLHDNYVIKSKSEGFKDHSLERAYPDEIIKN